MNGLTARGGCIREDRTNEGRIVCTVGDVDDEGTAFGDRFNDVELTGGEIPGAALAPRIAIFRI